MLEVFDGLFSSTWGLLMVLVFFNGAIYFHELGHYLAARWRGMTVERFSLFGLGPKLVSWHGKDGVEYCICAIPIGAFVAVPQLSDMAALEGESATAHLPPVTWLDKIIVAAAGPLFNVILAVLVGLVVWGVGVPTPEIMRSHTVGYVEQTLSDGLGHTVDGPAAKAGLRAGDVITAIDGQPVEDWRDLTTLIMTGTGQTEDGEPEAQITFERDGQPQTVTVWPIRYTYNHRTGEQRRMLGIQPGAPQRISGVREGSPADQAGLLPGDVILAADGTSVLSMATLRGVISQKAGAPVTLKIQREGDRGPTVLERTAAPELSPVSKPLVRLDSKNSIAGPLDVIPFYEALPQGAMHDPATPATLRVYLGGKRDALRPLRDGDQLVSVQGQPVGSLAEFLSGLQSAEGPLRLGLLRGEQTLDWSAPEGFSGKLIPAQQEALIGITTDSKRITRYPDPITQLSEHLNLTWVTLKSLFHPKSDIQVKHMAGAIEISRTVYTLSNIDWRLVLSFAVLLNINLAIMNLLPIPVLDGGHITLALISRLRGSPPPPHLVTSSRSL